MGIRFMAGLTVIAVFVIGLLAVKGLIDALIHTTIVLP